MYSTSLQTHNLNCISVWNHPIQNEIRYNFKSIPRKLINPQISPLGSFCLCIHTFFYSPFLLSFPLLIKSPLCISQALFSAILPTCLTTEISPPVGCYSFIRLYAEVLLLFFSTAGMQHIPQICH